MFALLLLLLLLPQQTIAQTCRATTTRCGTDGGTSTLWANCGVTELLGDTVNIGNSTCSAVNIEADTVTITGLSPTTVSIQGPAINIATDAPTSGTLSMGTAATTTTVGSAATGTTTITGSTKTSYNSGTTQVTMSVNAPTIPLTTKVSLFPDTTGDVHVGDASSTVFVGQNNAPSPSASVIQGTTIWVGNVYPSTQPTQTTISGVTLNVGNPSAAPTTTNIYGATVNMNDANVDTINIGDASATVTIKGTSWANVMNRYIFKQVQGYVADTTNGIIDNWGSGGDLALSTTSSVITMSGDSTNTGSAFSVSQTGIYLARFQIMGGCSTEGWRKAWIRRATVASTSDCTVTTNGGLTFSTDWDYQHGGCGPYLAGLSAQAYVYMTTSHKLFVCSDVGYYTEPQYPALFSLEWVTTASLV